MRQAVAALCADGILPEKGLVEIDSKTRHGPSLRWERGRRCTLDAAYLPAPENMVVGALSRSSVSLDSLSVVLDESSADLEVGGDLLGLMLRATFVKIENCSAIPVLSGLAELTARAGAAAPPEGRGLILIEKSFPGSRGVPRVDVWGTRADICVLDRSLSAFPDLCGLLCLTFGVDDFTVNTEGLTDRSPLAATLSSLPIRSLTVGGRDSWAAGVIHPGPGPLRTLIFTSRPGDMDGLARLLGPNESIVTLNPGQTAIPLAVDPINFRLLSGSTLSARNRKMRRALSSLLSALPALNTEDIPSEIGFAIRRVQARTSKN